MPELPEVELYLDALNRFVVGEPLQKIRIRSPSLLRSWDPKPGELEGRRLERVERLGKRILWGLEGDFWMVFHLMITGRFHWKKPGAKIPRKNTHAAFDFPAGSLFLTEMSTRKRAILHLHRDRTAALEHDRGGVEPLEATPAQFREALLCENRTLKRALTDPRLFSGIGNAHSDEILLAARLSPLQRTSNLSEEEVVRLHEATVAELTRFRDLLIAETGEGFPERVTAFHPEMRIHGRFREPCPQCGSPIQRIVHGEREVNYCAECQTGGTVLKDRALSRLLGEDWPRTLEEWEGLRER